MPRGGAIKALHSFLQGLPLMRPARRGALAIESQSPVRQQPGGVERPLEEPPVPWLVAVIAHTARCIALLEALYL